MNQGAGSPGGQPGPELALMPGASIEHGLMHSCDIQEGSMDTRDDRRAERESEGELQLNDPAASASREAAAAGRAEDLKVEGRGKQVAGEAAGGVGGAAVGAGLGTLVAGPIGTAIGAIAGAVGGWWAGHAATHAHEVYRAEDDDLYRAEYESSTNRAADRSYDDVRPAYQLGHFARHNPDYRGRAFDEIEDDLQKGWTDDMRNRYGDWPSVRSHVRAAYSRNPDLSRETVSERTVLRASEQARDRLAGGGRDGLRSDDTVGF